MKGLDMKWIKRVVILLVLLLIVIGVVGYLMIDQIAKAGVERGGTFAMGVDTELDDIHVGLFSGELSMNGLSVENPEGFKSDHFLKLGEGNVAVTLGSLMEDTVVIPTLHLSDIEMALEKDKGKANYQVILDNLARLSSDEEPAEDQAGKKFIVNEIVITNVKARAEVIGGMAVNVKIPEIRLKDVGSDSDKGVLLKDLSGIIVAAIMSSIVEQAGDVLPGGIGEGLQGGLAAVGDLGNFGVEVIGEVSAKAQEVLGEATKQIEGATDAAKEATKQAGEAVDKISEGIGGLLGGKKEETETKPIADE